MDQPAMNPAAPHDLPSFITVPGASDWLMTVMAFFLLAVVLSVGLLYLKLHALPEHMAHRTNKVQLQFVAVLSLIALFTHNHVFWIAEAAARDDRASGLLDPGKLDRAVARALSGRDRDPEGRGWNDVLSDDPGAVPRLVLKCASAASAASARHGGLTMLELLLCSP